MLLTLVNTNRMTPPIAPVGLEYVAAAAHDAGHRVEVVDLCLTEDPEAALAGHFRAGRADLVGLSFRNVDDCFWPSGQSFVPQLKQTVNRIRSLTDSPVVLGGVGFSIFARRIVAETGADFGIRGDGEGAMVALLDELGGRRRWNRVPGLIWRDGDSLLANPPAWPEQLAVPVSRDAVDLATYFVRGGQVGLETKRGCPRKCIYCADRLAKGTIARVRDPEEIALEVESLLAQGIDVVHLCDAEFNIPVEHARAVCEELIRRKLGERLRWYAYLTVVPFDKELAERMAAAGCMGINFTADSAAETMLRTYRQPHRAADLQNAVRLCRAAGIRVMLDLLLGGPGETPETAAETIRFVERIEPDCVGAALGVRLYPETAVTSMVLQDAPDPVPGLRRHDRGPIDLLEPTFYISPALGPRPAGLVRDLIGGNPIFFAPEDEPLSDGSTETASGDHNYNENRVLAEAIAAGARGAYWDILRQIRR